MWLPRCETACRACGAVVQAPAPELPVEKGRPGPGLLAVADGGPELLTGKQVSAVFGIEQRDGAWWPLPEDYWPASRC